MRLWAFQNRAAYDCIVKGETWYSTISLGRIKECDRVYIRKLDNWMSANPIYCFSRILGSRGLSLRTMVQAYAHLNGYYKLNLDDYGRILIELEVPESAILRCSLCNTNDEGVKSDFLKYTRQHEDDVECVLQEIRPEWVVAVHTFSAKMSHWSSDTIYSNEALNPCYVGKVYGDSGYPCVVVDKKLAFVKSEEDREKYYGEHCMRGVPKYYTLIEVDNCCDQATCDIIFGYAERKGIPVSKFRSLTVDELFDHRLK